MYFDFFFSCKFFLPVLDTVYLLVTDVSKSFDEQQLRLQHWISLLEARMGPFFRNPEVGVFFFSFFFWSFSHDNYQYSLRLDFAHQFIA